MKNILATALAAVLAVGCAAPASLGRMQPYLGEYTSCDEIAEGMEYVNRSRRPSLPIPTTRGASVSQRRSCSASTPSAAT